MIDHGSEASRYRGGEFLEEADAKVRIRKDKNFQGNKNARIRLRKNSNLSQFTNKRGDIDDDTYLHDEEINGTPEERKHKRMIAKMAKKYKVPVSAASGNSQQGGDGGGMPGGMM